MKKSELVMNEKMNGIVSNRNEFGIKSFEKFTIEQTGKVVKSQTPEDNATLKELYVVYMTDVIGKEVKTYEEAISIRGVLYRAWDYERNGEKRREHVRDYNAKKRSNKKSQETNISVMSPSLNANNPGFSMSMWGKLAKANNDYFAQRTQKQNDIIDNLLQNKTVVDFSAFLKLLHDDNVSYLSSSDKRDLEDRYVYYINQLYSANCKDFREAVELYLKNTSEQPQNPQSNPAEPVNNNTVDELMIDIVPTTESTLEYEAKNKFYKKRTKLICDWFDLYVDWKVLLSSPALSLPQFMDLYTHTIKYLWRLDKDDDVKCIVEKVYDRYLNSYRCKQRNWFR